MRHTVQDILDTLDRCAEAFTFPVLDNGYVYPAATRLALFGSPTNWGLTVEVFGFSPRSGCPDIAIYSFGSALVRSPPPASFVSAEAHQNFLRRHPHNGLDFVYPIGEESWLDAEDPEQVAATATTLELRGGLVPIPQTADAYETRGIQLTDPPRVAVFELCRYLAAVHREAVLAGPEERRVRIGGELPLILQLEEWHHPDIVEGERPGTTETFRQLAEVAVTADPSHYQPGTPPNTHWRNWPEGGTL